MKSYEYTYASETRQRASLAPARFDSFPCLLPVGHDHLRCNAARTSAERGLNALVGRQWGAGQPGPGPYKTHRRPGELRHAPLRGQPLA